MKFNVFLVLLSVPCSAAVSFTGLSTVSGNQTSTNGTPVVSLMNFTDDVSSESGVARITYVSTYENGFTETGSPGSNFFPNNPATGALTAQSGLWTIEFFTDGTFSTASAVTNFALGITHLNDIGVNTSEDFFHNFKVNGSTQVPTPTNIAANHYFDAAANAIGSRNVTSPFTVSTLTFSGAVSTLTFEAGAVDLTGNSIPIPTGDAGAPFANFQANPAVDYVTVGIDTGVFSGGEVVPEPSSGVLSLLALSCLVGRRSRK